jgi:hypothetical protein
MCNGCKILVTGNLFDALDQLSQMPDVDFLWIDALCINQEDLDERAEPGPYYGRNICFICRNHCLAGKAQCPL